MIRSLFGIFIMIVFISCESSNSNYSIGYKQVKNDSISKEIISLDTLNSPIVKRIVKEITQGQIEVLNSQFKNVRIIYLNDTIFEDLNGDGFIEKAVFASENGKSGIIIIDGNTKENARIGLGNAFEEMNNDFSWVDYWGIVKDSSTYEVIIDNFEIIGSEVVLLINPSIVLRAEDEGGGIITFRNGKYEWIHQAD